MIDAPPCVPEESWLMNRRRASSPLGLLFIHLDTEKREGISPPGESRAAAHAEKTTGRGFSCSLVGTRVTMWRSVSQDIFQHPFRSVERVCVCVVSPTSRQFLKAGHVLNNLVQHHENPRKPNSPVLDVPDEISHHVEMEPHVCSSFCEIQILDLASTP